MKLFVIYFFRFYICIFSLDVRINDMCALMVLVDSGTYYISLLRGKGRGWVGGMSKRRRGFVSWLGAWNP